MKIFILILLSLNLNAKTPAWFDDKAKHWWVAFGLTVVTAEITYQITDKVNLSVCAGGIIGEGATLGKELIWDGYLGKGVRSLGDGVVGTMGTVTGMMVMTVKFDIQRKKENRPIYKDYYN
jgi:hypothetical protein